MKKKLYLIGGGGHCKSIISVVESGDEYDILGILDQPEKVNTTVLNYPIIDSDDHIGQYVNHNTYFLITVGQIKQAAIRQQLFEKVNAAKGNLAKVVASTAYIGKHVSLAPGVTVGHNAVINTGVSIGENCIINTGAIVEHDAQIGAHSHISTGAVVNGDCHVGPGCFVGSNAVLNHGVQLAPGTVIGAGSVVISNISSAGIYVGNPATKNN